MKVYIKRDLKTFYPFSQSAAEVELLGETVLGRLQRQLQNLGCIIVSQETDQCLIISDRIWASDLFWAAILQKTQTSPQGFECLVDRQNYYAVSSNATQKPIQKIDLKYRAQNGQCTEQFTFSSQVVFKVPLTLPAVIFGNQPISVDFVDAYCLELNNWVDLLTASALAAKEHTAETILFFKKFLPDTWINYFLAKSWIANKTNRIGKNCKIHPTAVLEGCRVGDNVEIGAHCYLRASYIGDCSIIREGSSVKVTHIEHDCYCMPCDFFNSYIGAHSSIITSMVYNCCIGARTFIGGGSGFSDFDSTHKTIRIQTLNSDIDSGELLLASGVGDDCFIGAGLLFSPGRTIPSHTTIINSQLIHQIPQEIGRKFYVADKANLIKIPTKFLEK